ncbi:MAG: hypothetical protein L0154_09280 [Chloroflexi bacterium]|nr:hypothetical protein [Chloroflexota bacterium]
MKTQTPSIAGATSPPNMVERGTLFENEQGVGYHERADTPEFVEKPLDPDSFMETVERLLKRQAV